MKRLNMDDKPVEETLVPNPPATWTSTERDPDTGLMKEPKKTEEAANVTPE